MGDNNIDASYSSKIVSDLKAFQKDNPGVKNIKQLTTIFNAMDKDNSGTIEENEGTLFYFGDGTISATRCEKSIKEDGTQVEHYRMFMSADDNGVYEYDKDGNVKKSVREQEDGSKFEFGYTNDRQLAYKKYTDKEGNEFLLSPANNKTLAGIEKDGSIRTFHNPADSFDGTMIRLGLDPSDPEIRAEFAKANPEAFQNDEKPDRFTLVPNDPSAMRVRIPKSILEKYDVVFYDNEIGLKQKTEGSPKTQPWEKPDGNAERIDAIRKYAEQVANGNNWHKVPANPAKTFLDPTPVTNGAEVNDSGKPLSPAQAIPVTTGMVATKGDNIENSPDYQEAISNIPNPKELANDKVFQRYRNSLINSYKKMAQDAAIGGWKIGTDPAKIDSFAKVDHMDEWSSYTRLSTYCNRTLSALNNYVQEMSNWQDNAQAGNRTIGTAKFTNPVRITLSDGQRAWKCNEGVFYPYHDGLVGGAKVPEELIP